MKIRRILNYHFGNEKYESAVSPVIAEALFVFIIVIIAAILLIMLLGMIELPYFQQSEEKAPLVFKITYLESSPPKYEGIVTLTHIGMKSYINSNLRAEFYRDGTKLGYTLETLHNYKIISGEHHYGIQNVKGSGASNELWLPTEKVSINFMNGLFHNNETIRVDIFDKTTGELISSDSALFPI